MKELKQIRKFSKYSKYIIIPKEWGCVDDYVKFEIINNNELLLKRVNVTLEDLELL
jgi:hypothetical protein